MSRKIADLFDDERYFAAPGSLSDYETLISPPRHIHKVITLCLIYGVPFGDLLISVAGVTLEELGRDPIPIKAGPISDHAKGEGALERVASQGANPVLTFVDDGIWGGSVLSSRIIGCIFGNQENRHCVISSTLGAKADARHSHSEGRPVRSGESA